MSVPTERATRRAGHPAAWIPSLVSGKPSPRSQQLHVDVAVFIIVEREPVLQGLVLVEGLFVSPDGVIELTAVAAFYRKAEVVRGSARELDRGADGRIFSAGLPAQPRLSLAASPRHSRTPRITPRMAARGRRARCVPVPPAFPGCPVRARLSTPARACAPRAPRRDLRNDSGHETASTCGWNSAKRRDGTARR